MAQRHRGFESSQGRTEAIMCTVSKGQRCRASACKPQLVGLIEDRGVTIGSGDNNESLLTAGYFDISDELALGRGTRGCLHWSIKPEQFVDQRRICSIQAVGDVGAIGPGGE